MQFNSQASWPTKQQVCVEAALVSLIKHQDAVAPEQQIALQLAQQNPVRHELHCSVLPNLPVIPHLHHECISSTIS